MPDRRWLRQTHSQDIRLTSTQVNNSSGLLCLAYVEVDVFRAKIEIVLGDSVHLQLRGEIDFQYSCMQAGVLHQPGRTKVHTTNEGTTILRKSLTISQFSPGTIFVLLCFVELRKSKDACGNSVFFMRKAFALHRLCSKIRIR